MRVPIPHFSLILVAMWIFTPPAAIASAPVINPSYETGVREARSNLAQKIHDAQNNATERMELLLRLAALDFADDDYKAAKIHLAEIIAGVDAAKQPDVVVSAERFLGLTYLVTKQMPQSIEHYNTALRILDTGTSDQDSKLTRLHITRGLNDALLKLDANDQLIASLKNETKLAQELNLHCDAGWAFLKLSDVQRVAGNVQDADRSLDRAVIEFTRFFNSASTSEPAGEAESTDLWEALDAGPARPPGGFWLSKTQPAKAVVLCIHGLGLHSGYYAALGKALSERGVTVAAMDVRGFGQWANSRADEQINIAASVDDAVNLVRVLKRLNTGVPVFLLGESMGGAIALRAAPRADVSGVISSVPAADRYNSFATKLHVAWHVITAGNSAYDVRSDVVEKVSRDEALREAWENDKLAKLEYAPTQLIGFDRFMNDNLKDAAAVEKPVLITQGDKDELVKADSTVRLFRALSSKQKDLLLIGSAEHLIFEAGRFSDLLLDAIVSWMTAIGAKAEH
jgi:acylglycerol lipase